MVEKKESKAAKKAKQPAKPKHHAAPKAKKHKAAPKKKGVKHKENAESAPKEKVKEKAAPKHKAATKEITKPEEKAKAVPKTEEAAKPKEKVTTEEGAKAEVSPEEEKPKAVKKKKLKEKKEKPIEKIKFTGKKELSKDEKPLMKRRFSERKGKPKFRRQEAHKLKRLDEKWRRPRGIDSKRQDGQKSKGAVPAIGYGKTASVRGIHPSGYYPILVRNPDELGTIKSDKEAAIISASVGRKKRNLIIKLANELKIAILNPRKGEL